MAFENLTEREKKVLYSLITHYIQTADPVGSRAIANRYRLGVSPATIRNTMQDLEELGLVTQPHTSAGRIPTDAGYRLFVDHLLREERLTAMEKKSIKEKISAKAGGLDSILEQTSRVLADLSHELGVTITPRFDESVLTRIELLKMAEGKVLVVMAMTSGIAKTILVEVEASIKEDDLIVMTSVLNEKLAGLTIGELRKTIQARLSESAGNPQLLRLFLEADSDLWQGLASDQLHLIGTENIIDKPEFSDRAKLQEFMKLIGSRTNLIDLFSKRDDEGGIIITIGAENQAKEIQTCSVVSATYQVGTSSGTIGIIGPTRMPYAKLVSVVHYVARQLNDVLAER